MKPARRRTSTVVARRPCRTPTKTFCGVVFRGARRLQKLFFALAGCRRRCAIMNFWLVEVLESTLESRHDFTLGSECGLLRHSAMKFAFGEVYLSTDFCVSASHGWCACDRRGLRPAIWRMKTEELDTRSRVSLWRWSFHTSLVSDSHLFGVVSPEKCRILITSGDDFWSCFRILGLTADTQAHASVYGFGGKLHVFPT